MQYVLYTVAALSAVGVLGLLWYEWQACGIMSQRWDNHNTL